MSTSERSPATTGKAIWHTSMSLDGFVAGPDHAMEWAFDYEYGVEGTRLIDEVIATTGAIVSGRNGFDATFGPEEAQAAFGGRWSGPEFILSHRPPPPDHANPNETFLNLPPADAIAHAKAAANGRNVLVFGATTAGWCLNAGAIDELLIHIAPIMLGAGIRLYGDVVTETIQLKLLEVSQMGDIATLRLVPTEKG